MSERTKDDQSDSAPGLLALFVAFFGIAVMGFGGVLPWARRMLVEERAWLTAEEFTEVLSLGQFLPGGNIINVSVVVGQRFHGALGSIVALVGLLAAPCTVILFLGELYLRYADLPRVHGALGGLTAAAVGLILSLALKLAKPLLAKRALVPLLVAALTFVAVGFLRVPLPLAVLVLAPISVALAWWRRP